MQILKKALIGVFCVISILIMYPISIVHAEWKQDSTGWWYTEGNSWATGWKYINNSWYYFGKDGYMAHDTIINNYYLNSDGVYSKGGEEVDAYWNALNDNSWLQENGIIFKNGKSYIEKAVVLDVNQDGILDMLIWNGTCSADYKVSVFTYSNSKEKIIKLKDIETFSGGYLGYSSSKKVFLVSGGHMDNYFTDGYTIEDDKCVNYYESTEHVDYLTDNNRNVISESHKYTLNGKEVSEKEYNDNWIQLGEIKK